MFYTADDLALFQLSDLDKLIQGLGTKLVNESVPLFELNESVHAARLSLTEPKGNITLLGMTGSGKTTTINLLLRALTPSPEVYSRQAACYGTLINDREEFWRHPLPSINEEVAILENEANDPETNRNEVKSPVPPTKGSATSIVEPVLPMCLQPEENFCFVHVVYRMQNDHEKNALEYDSSISSFLESPVHQRLQSVNVHQEEKQNDEKFERLTRDYWYAENRQELDYALKGEELDEQFTTGFFLPARGPTHQIYRLQHGKS